MSVDAKLQVHNITSKTALGYVSKVWTTNKRDAQEIEAPQMRF
jgi:hypothetical protein